MKTIPTRDEYAKLLDSKQPQPCQAFVTKMQLSHKLVLVWTLSLKKAENDRIKCEKSSRVGHLPIRTCLLSITNPVGYVHPLSKI
jgi:hypothetical protein